MVNSKQRKIVTIVCIVLGVLLIAGGIIGTLLYLNSNEYRFRMNVFIGKYYSYNLVMSDRNTQYIKIYDSDNGNNKYNVACVSLKDGNVVVEFKDNENKAVSQDQIDKNVLQQVQYLANLFSGSCYVEKDKIIFDKTELAIVKNEFVTENPEYSFCPTRDVCVKDEKTNEEFEFSFFTAYVKKGEPKFVYHPDYNDFCIEINRKNIVGEDGKIYRLTMQDSYYTEESREIMKKEGVSK